MRKFYIALFLSLLFHLSQYGLVSYWPSLESKNQKSQNEIVEIELIPTPEIVEEKKSLPIAKTIQDKSSKMIDKSAEFLSDKTNRTKQQTKAQESGQFRQSEKPERPKTEKIKNDSDFFTQQRQNLPSRSEYQLPNDMQTGSAVNLNTDADIYASFYNRVVDLFYIRWIQRLDQIWNQTPEETKRNLSNRRWITDVEILLNSNGQYVKGMVTKRSGYNPFDAAAIYGFSNAGFFPNPPKGKVEADGFIRLKYRISISVR